MRRVSARRATCFIAAGVLGVVLTCAVREGVGRQIVGHWQLHRGFLSSDETRKKEALDWFRAEKWKPAASYILAELGVPRDPFDRPQMVSSLLDALRDLDMGLDWRSRQLVSSDTRKRRAIVWYLGPDGYDGTPRGDRWTDSDWARLREMAMSDADVGPYAIDWLLKLGVEFRPIRLVETSWAGLMIECELRNLWGFPFWFLGYGSRRPLTHFFTRQESGEWVSVAGDWCGTGSKMRILKPGESFRFLCRVRRSGVLSIPRGSTVRLGLSVCGPEVKGGRLRSVTSAWGPDFTMASNGL
ncbi:MAG: hypothetical protein AAF517_24075 [Planctomycetota bacterium]